MYWSFIQQLAHHTVNGCNARTGDLYGTGTISGPTEDSFGSLLELSWNGAKELSLHGGAGSVRKFIEDGDEIIMEAWCERNGVKIGWGGCRGTILPAIEFKP